MVCRDQFDQSLSNERTFGRRPRGPANSLGVAWKYPRVAPALAGIANRFGVVRRVTKHENLGSFWQWKFTNQIGCCLGRRAVCPALLLAVLLSIERLAERNPDA